MSRNNPSSLCVPSASICRTMSMVGTVPLPKKTIPRKWLPVGSAPPLFILSHAGINASCAANRCILTAAFILTDRNIPTAGCASGSVYRTALFAPTRNLTKRRKHCQCLNGNQIILVVVSPGLNFPFPSHVASSWVYYLRNESRDLQPTRPLMCDTTLP